MHRNTHMPPARLAGMLAAAIVLCAFAAAPSAEAEVLRFEDIFGPCGDYDLVRGPGAVTLEGVTFTSPDIYTYNVGKEESYPPGLGNPFDSDSYHFFTFGGGATVLFPAEVSRVRFITGERTNMSDWPTFQLIAGGAVLATFGANMRESARSGGARERSRGACTCCARVAGSTRTRGR